jgi:hypothetical protein
MEGARFFFVDGLFLHGPGSGEDWSFLLAPRTYRPIYLLGYGRGLVALWLMHFLFHFPLLNRVLFPRKGGLPGPSERREAGGFGTAEFLIPVCRTRGRLDMLDGLFVDSVSVFVLLVQRLGNRLVGGEDGLVLGEGRGQRGDRPRRGFRLDRSE